MGKSYCPHFTTRNWGKAIAHTSLQETGEKLLPTLQYKKRGKSRRPHFATSCRPHLATSCHPHFTTRKWGKSYRPHFTRGNWGKTIAHTSLQETGEKLSPTLNHKQLGKSCRPHFTTRNSGKAIAHTSLQEIGEK